MTSPYAASRQGFIIADAYRLYIRKETWCKWKKKVCPLPGTKGLGVIVWGPHQFVSVNNGIQAAVQSRERGLVQQHHTSDHAATRLGMCCHGNHLPLTHWRAALCVSVIAAERSDVCAVCIVGWSVCEREGNLRRKGMMWGQHVSSNRSVRLGFNGLCGGELSSYKAIVGICHCRFHY